MFTVGKGSRIWVKGRHSRLLTCTVHVVSKLRECIVIGCRIASLILPPVSCVQLQSILFQDDCAHMSNKSSPNKAHYVRTLYGILQLQISRPCIYISRMKSKSLASLAPINLKFLDRAYISRMKS